MKYWALLLCGLLASFRISGIEASAQEYAGPLLPHVGGQITAAFANRYGPDAEAYFTFRAVTPELLSLNLLKHARIEHSAQYPHGRPTEFANVRVGLRREHASHHTEHDIARYLGNVARGTAQHR